MKLGEYYALKGSRDEAELLGDVACFLFTPSQLRVAHERWHRLGRRRFITEEDKLRARCKRLALEVECLRFQSSGARPLLRFLKNIWNGIRRLL
jgi:hypothetical protein